MKQGAAQACMKLFLGSCSLRTVSCETFNLSKGACHAAIRSGRITCFIIPPLLCNYRAAAADPQGLNTNFPVQIEDAFPINFGDRKSTRLNSSHMSISYAVFCLKKKK